MNFASALLTVTIRSDLGLTENEVLNSNIIAGVSSLLVRLGAGFASERFGPRKVLVAILWASALPCGLAGTAMGVKGLYFIRFFMGLAGGAFVPAQVWVTAWFDKSVMGTATACAAGWGDSGIGWTFFVMPAIYNGFINHGHPQRIAWRISFVFPCLFLIAVSAAIYLLCDDTPKGAWANRNLPAPTSSHSSSTTVVNVLDAPADANKLSAEDREKGEKEKQEMIAHEEMVASRRGSAATVESGLSTAPLGGQQQPLSPPPTLKAGLKDVACLPTLMLAATYAATFGSSLAINSIIVPWIMSSQGFDQTTAGHHAATLGLLNLISRPFGGIMADIIARRVGAERNLNAKKYWMAALTVIQGCFGVLLGLLNPPSLPTLMGLIVAYGFFMQAANGACYAVLPAVNTHVNGLMGGAVGSAGNLGERNHLRSSIALLSVPTNHLRRCRSQVSPDSRRRLRRLELNPSSPPASIIVGFLSAFVNPVPKRQRRQADASAK
ncbi:major facilitator superfamily domain-containing protein [Leucosporidium creatinivorum]|uniref:Major facilitator superfamily domain-containing protein n=1 Tax=Leucosporidium creatinivorum TaxID=106004 RepID=A0A1Y2G0M6_9BASI|nr:major facilitator superfamily domain-containing protein [Leucosporidium creatinivorum]